MIEEADGELFIELGVELRLRNLLSGLWERALPQLKGKQSIVGLFQNSIGPGSNAWWYVPKSSMSSQLSTAGLGVTKMGM